MFRHPRFRPSNGKEVRSCQKLRGMYAAQKGQWKDWKVRRICRTRIQGRWASLASALTRARPVLAVLAGARPGVGMLWLHEARGKIGRPGSNVSMDYGPHRGGACSTAVVAAKRKLCHETLVPACLPTRWLTCVGTQLTRRPACRRCFRSTCRLGIPTSAPELSPHPYGPQERHVPVQAATHILGCPWLSVQ